MLQERLSKEEQKALQGKTAAYNVFLDSCREQYEERVRKLGIPEGTSLPVLIVGDRWVSGLEQMEELLREAAGKAADHSGPAEGGLPGEEQQADGSGGKKESKNSDLQRVGEHAADQKEADLAKCMETELESQEPALLLFTTESCEDCEKVKEWLAEQKELTGGRVLEYNIVKEPCLNILKGMFREYGLGEQDQKVPALFYGNGAATGAEAIFRLDGETLFDFHVFDAVVYGGGRESLRLEKRTAVSDREICGLCDDWNGNLYFCRKPGWIDFAGCGKHPEWDFSPAVWGGGHIVSGGCSTGVPAGIRENPYPASGRPAD